MCALFRLAYFRSIYGQHSLVKAKNNKKKYFSRVIECKTFLESGPLFNVS